MKRLAVLYLSFIGSLVLATKKNLIIDTDLFSDVDDAGALLLAATSPDVNLLAVNVNYPSSYSALAASAILAHYGKPDVPIGIPRPLSNITFFDSWYFTLGEYASKVAYHFSGGSLRWGHADDAWDPVELYRKVLSEAEDSSVTIVSIRFLDNLSGLLNSPPDAHSPFPGRALTTLKVAELIIMGGGYPTGRTWNFWGSPSGPAAAAHVINTWGDDDHHHHSHSSRRGPPVRMTFLGSDVGAHVRAGGPLVAEGPAADPVRLAYRWYGYEAPARAAWDPLAVVYAVRGLAGDGDGGGQGGLFRVGDGGCEGGCEFNWVGEDGGNRWVCEGEGEGGRGGMDGVVNEVNGVDVGRGSRRKCARNQRFLRLAVANKTAAAEVDRLFLEGAWSVVGSDKKRVQGDGIYGSAVLESGHEEL